MNYKSKRWRNLRESILRRDNYLCQISLRYGRHVQADTVHHVFPASQYPEYEWMPWNLISVERSVHNRLHYRDSEALTAEGEALRLRIAKKHNVKI